MLKSHPKTSFSPHTLSTAPRWRAPCEDPYPALVLSSRAGNSCTTSCRTGARRLEQEPHLPIACSTTIRLSSSVTTRPWPGVSDWTSTPSVPQASMVAVIREQARLSLPQVSWCLAGSLAVTGGAHWGGQV